MARAHRDDLRRRLFSDTRDGQRTLKTLEHFRYFYVVIESQEVRFLLIKSTRLRLVASMYR